MNKSKLIVKLIESIHRCVPDDSIREEIYSEFAVELAELNNISFLDECTDDEVFWDVLRTHGMCDPEIVNDDDGDSDNDEDLRIVDDSSVGLSCDFDDCRDDEEDYNPFEELMDEDE